MLLQPREMITMVCNEWNRNIYRSSIHRERYWRQQLPSSTITSLFIKHIALTRNWNTHPTNTNHSSPSPSAIGHNRKGWWQRGVAHSTLRDRWRSGRYKQTKDSAMTNLLSSFSSSVLMCDGSYLLGLSGLQSVDDHLLNLGLSIGRGIQSLVCCDLMNDFPIKQIKIPSERSLQYRELIPVSESSICVVAVAEENVTLVNMTSGNWSKPIQAPNWHSSDCVMASHGQPNQPMAYLSSDSNLLEEWDLSTMTKVRDITTQGHGYGITMNDDHTYIARSNYYNDSVVEIIDRRTALPGHQIKNAAPQYSRYTALKWHGNHIMTSYDNTLQLFDIRKGDSSSASALLSSTIWSINLQRDSIIKDFSNDFQIALVRDNHTTTMVVDITSTATPIYTLPTDWDLQMTYDRLLSRRQVQLLDFS
jgi:hypothetical protein